MLLGLPITPFVELILLLVLKASISGFDDCASKTLLTLCGAMVLSGIIQCVMYGSSVCVVSLQTLLSLIDTGLCVAAIVIASNEIGTSGWDCWIAIVSLVFGVFELLEASLILLLWLGLLALRIHQDQCPPPNLYVIVESLESVECVLPALGVPASMHKSALYEPRDRTQEPQTAMNAGMLDLGEEGKETMLQVVQTFDTRSET